MDTMTSNDLTDAELDRAFAALADRTRRTILAQLTHGQAGVLEIAGAHRISQPAITKHLKVLESAGLISRHRDAQRRLCRLEPERLAQLVGWIGSYRRFWERRFAGLDDLLDELQADRGADE